MEAELEAQKMKNQALLEKISQLTTQYEDQAANFRVEVTLLSRRANELAQRNQELEQSVQEIAPAEDPQA